jgi:hypothetical protein
MIKNIKEINNQSLKTEYNKMISEMYEHVYKFNPGIKLGFKPKKVSLIDYKTFNFFAMYNKNIHILYKEISNLTKEYCIESGVNFERNYFYLLGNIIKKETIPLNTYVNFAPNYKTTFVGFYVIDCNKDEIYIDDEKIELVPGQLMFLNSSSKILFKEISNGLTMLSFNISPLEYLYRQYYQKWIPLA